MKNKHRGSSFDEFLREEGLFEACTAEAHKRVDMFQAEQKLEQHIVSYESTCEMEALIGGSAK
jgi:hypothetical protein